MRIFSALSMLMAGAWILVLSIPLGLKAKDKKLRRKITQSTFYANVAAVLSGVAFLPTVFGLLLPLSCGGGESARQPGSNSSATVSLSPSPNGNTSSTNDGAISYACWEGNHLTTVAVSLELLLVVLLTNVGVNLSEWSAGRVAREASEAKDSGLDLLYASSYLAGLKLLQAVLVFVAVAGAVSGSGGPGTSISTLA